MFATTASAGFLSAATTTGWPTKDTVAYKLDTRGYDVRVYEWTPDENPNIRCVFVAGETNSTGVACYEVSAEKKK